MSPTEVSSPFDEHFRFPADLADARPGPPGRVAVVGGGISGLACAHELARRGLDVTVYERGERPGGRIRTHRFWDGTHGELGAMRLPANHHTTLHYVRRFGLATRPFVNANPDAWLHLRGSRVRARDAHTLPARYGLSGPEDRDPLGLLEELLHRVWYGLRREQHKAVLAGEIDDPEVAALTETSLWQYASSRLSPRAWDLAGQATGLAHYEHASLLEVLVDYFGLFHVAQLELTDGMDALVSAFTGSLPPHTVHLSTHVERLHTDADGVRIQGRGLGGRFDDHHDWAVCALPAPALDRIRFDPALPPGQRQAVRGIHYASSSKTLVHVNRRTWELADGIHGGGSVTDLPIQHAWYPSDNARAQGDSWVAVDPDRSHGPAVLTGAYLWEGNARRFGALPEEDRTGLVLESLEALHPGISATVDDIVHWNWDEQPGIAGGAFAYLAPGQHARYLADLGAPHPAPRPRIFFAGEQLSVAHAWIQGALESALVAVRALLAEARSGAAAR
ncbi:FAD-dependent oxidoreductase [Streptomyces triticagri]|uniref:FAD-dependent oxidoreductase n=1 Tax=Streptomyces triticagri TaxID=2293568 RepID=A0A372M0F7_9ACTN|nr:FAD-dependent oxidoreductase [Streptomyces triticagri]RFU84013.1 FAD-dependent oxidoreductase [Streptomyces triticagri]